MDMGGYCGGDLPSVNDLDIAAAAAEAAMEVLAPSSSEEDSDDDDDEDDSSSSGSGDEDVDMVGDVRLHDAPAMVTWCLPTAQGP